MKINTLYFPQRMHVPAIRGAVSQLTVGIHIKAAEFAVIDGVGGVLVTALDASKRGQSFFTNVMCDFKPEPVKANPKADPAPAPRAPEPTPNELSEETEEAPKGFADMKRKELLKAAAKAGISGASTTSSGDLVKALEALAD